MTSEKLNSFLEAAIRASIVAGGDIIEVYTSPNFDVTKKDDNSPLTLADRKAHERICEMLESTNLPILSEEGRSIHYDERKSWEYFWLIDPLDGTKEFIKKNDEFTVNIALINKGKPVLGVVYSPVLEQLYYGGDFCGAFKMNDTATVNFESTEILLWQEFSFELPIVNKRETFTVVGSRSHMNAETEAYFEQLRKSHGNIEIITKGSSLKLCMVAEGEADIYPRFAPTSEWDIAAGHAIISAAGGKVVQKDEKTPLFYNKPDLLNPWFVAWV